LLLLLPSGVSFLSRGLRGQRLTLWLLLCLASGVDRGSLLLGEIRHPL
jgi:hypothetical protein